MSQAAAESKQLAGSAAQRTQAIHASVWAVLLGSFIILAVGFTQPQALHDAAHDTRHAFAFPCH
ncbi:MAG: CbtB domain-containing protein [bacterium]